MCNVVPSLAVATTVLVQTRPQPTKRLLWNRDTLVICCIFTAFLYFYRLVLFQWRGYLLGPYRGTAQPPYLLEYIYLMASWIGCFWYLLIPCIFLPCFIVAWRRAVKLRGTREGQCGPCPAT
jgi:hypothetical protein